MVAEMGEEGGSCVAGDLGYEERQPRAIRLIHNVTWGGDGDLAAFLKVSQQKLELMATSQAWDQTPALSSHTWPLINFPAHLPL